MVNLEESLSALLDGECTAAELDAVLDACGHQPDLLHRFGRFCAVREIHAGRAVNRVPEDFCGAVMRSLDVPGTAPVLPLRAMHLPHRRRARTTWFKAGGLALAASFGAVVALTGYHYVVTPAVMQVADAGSTTTAVPVVAAARGNSIVAVAAPKVDEVSWSQLDPETTQHLDDYMMEHTGYGSVQMMNGALGYARITAQPVRYSAVGGTH
ncbi:MAG: hypothetical protein EPN72_04030 [Nevskiaceae bacterium]|nr:MAG: hypothetical protein EPN63_06810 [Nevskiaceae bacterium]TBR73987.1 MAG: hypothetical protein EPN72_04030 [Nevskiaceae bacterium]